MSFAMRGAWGKGLLVAAAALLAGCAGRGAKMIPPPSPEMAGVRTLAVLEFGNDSEEEGAGRRLAVEIERLLHEKGTYRLVPREEVVSWLGALAKSPASPGGGILGALGREKSLDAVLAGRVLRDVVRTYRERRYRSRPVRGFGLGWRRLFPSAKEPYDYVRVEAEVEAETKVIGMESGKVLYQGRGEGGSSWSGAAPIDVPLRLRERAEREAARDIVRSLILLRKGGSP